MTRTFALVVNPAAGGGRAGRLLPAVSGVLDDAGARHQVSESASLEHAKELARDAAGRGEVVAAFGGDGMVGALAGAVAAAGGVFGIIPAGRGNDFARTLGIPFAPADAARLLVHGQERPCDLIGVGGAEPGARGTDARGTGDGAVDAGGTVAGGTGAGGAARPGPAELVVAGSVYLGVPAVAGEIARRSRVPPGEMAYPVAGLRAVLGWRTATFRMQLDDGAAHEFDGGVVVVANSRYFGAGMMVAPQADTGDGLLDVVYIRGGSKLAMLRGLTRLKEGSHLSMPEVGTARAASVTITAGRAMPAGADGEPLACAGPLEPGRPLRIRALPGALRVIS